MCSSLGRPKDQSTKVQKFKATLWLAGEFPLSLPEQVVPIIDLMAASNAHFRKLKDFITLQLPAGFPVKIGEREGCRGDVAWVSDPFCISFYSPSTTVCLK